MSGEGLCPLGTCFSSEFLGAVFEFLRAHAKTFLVGELNRLACKSASTYFSARFGIEVLTVNCETHSLFKIIKR